MTNLQAIDLLKGLEQSLDDYCELNDEGKTAFRMAITALEVFGNSEQLPSAEPEIIRCGQCKYAEAADSEDNQDGYTCQFHRGSIWFSGSYCSWAERREECTP